MNFAKLQFVTEKQICANNEKIHKRGGKRKSPKANKKKSINGSQRFTLCSSKEKIGKCEFKYAEGAVGNTVQTSKFLRGRHFLNKCTAPTWWGQALNGRHIVVICCCCCCCCHHHYHAGAGDKQGTAKPKNVIVGFSLFTAVSIEYTSVLRHATLRSLANRHLTASLSRQP
jgi:hypothetical protein